MNDLSNTNWKSMYDSALIKTIGEFIQHHRVEQNRTQAEVAEEASISRSTLSLLERGEKITLNTLIQVLRVLDLLYIMDVFKIKYEVSPIEYAKLKKHKNKRARRKRNQSKPTDDTELGW